jgi:hypothetical protein
MASLLTNSAGLLCAWLPVVLYFFIHDALGEFINAAFLYNVQYGAGSQPSLSRVMFLTLDNLKQLWSLVICIIVGTGIYCTQYKTFWQQQVWHGDRARVLFVLVVLWVVFDLLGALAGGRSYPHYFLPLALSLSVGGGVTIWLLYDRIRGNTQAQAALAALILGPLILSQASDVRELAYRVREGRALAPWEQVASELSSIRGPNDTLFTWGYFPGIHFATGMKSPSRLLTTNYLYAASTAYSKFGKELLEALYAAPPRFVVAFEPVMDADDPVSERLRAILVERYTFMSRIHQLKVYQRAW